MTYDRMRLAARTMRREHTPFHDAVADLLEHRAAVGVLGPSPQEVAVAETYLSDPGDLPESEVVSTGLLEDE